MSSRPENIVSNTERMHSGQETVFFASKFIDSRPKTMISGPETMHSGP